MSDQSQSQQSYPPEATGVERKLLEFAACSGIILISLMIALMGAGMYLLPNAPPVRFPLPLF